MKILLFMDPIPGSGAVGPGLEGAERLARMILTGLGTDLSDTRICAPRELMGKLRRALGPGSTDKLLQPGTLMQSFMETCQPWITTEPRHLSARAEYLRGEGTGAEELESLLTEIHSTAFDFDLILTSGCGLATETAARRMKVASARFEIWPAGGGRWRPYGFLHFRDKEGRSAFDQVTAETLKRSEIRELPASLDQRFLGYQRGVNPFESRFAPLTGNLARGFSPQRKVALITVEARGGANRAIGGAFADNQAFLDHVLPKLLEREWQCGLLLEDKERSPEVKQWLNHDRVFSHPVPPRLASQRIRREFLTLLATADLLVTDTSPVGLEAVLMETSACVLGKPFYKVPGIFPEWPDVLDSGSVEKESLERASLLRGFLLRHYGTPLATLIPGGLLKERVRQGCELNERGAEDPDTWLRELHDFQGRTAEDSALRDMRERDFELEPVEAE